MGFMYEIAVFLIVITFDAAIFWKLRIINKNHVSFKNLLLHYSTLL